MAEQEGNLRKILEEIAKQENYKLPKINIIPSTSDGANYSASLYEVTISEQLKPDLHLFVKVANTTEEIRAQNPNFTSAYIVEALFYTEIALDFERIYNKNNVPLEDRMLRPKYYGHTLTLGNETLVLENLTIKGFQSYDRFKPFSWEYASTALTELAKFHAMGLALRDESQTEFEKLVGRLSPNMMTNGEFNQFVSKSAENACEFIDEKYKARLQRYCNVAKYEELISVLLKKSTMLVFSDFRPSNLMHRRHNGKLEVITLDYQTLTLGYPVVDLIFFIFSASDEEFRRLYYKNLLDHYFTRLTLALKQLKVDVEKVYPRKTFEEDMDDLKPLGLFIGLGSIPLLLVDPKDAPEKIEGMEAFIVKPNQRALERMNGIVRDFVKWGVI